MNAIFRIIDANINRVSEGIRVIEDLFRFRFELIEQTAKLREMRHQLRKSFQPMEHELINARDASSDVGLTVSSAGRLDNKQGVRQLMTANFKRVQEGLRSLEENLKIAGYYELSKQIEKFRFEIYTLEKESRSLGSRALPGGIYAITAEKFSRGRSNLEVVRHLVNGGVRVIQYREKHGSKSFRQMYLECREISKICREEDVLFIVNDYIELAMLVDADGVHVGQDDIPIEAVRKIAGDKIIGVSTHSPKQAQQAVAQGADYIGVGPIFATNTKEDVCAPVGIEYLEYVAANIKIPFVAIGGIKAHNIHEVSKRGAGTICLVTEIVGAENISEMMQKLNSIMGI